MSNGSTIARERGLRRRGDEMRIGDWFALHVIEPLEPVCYFVLPPAVVIGLVVWGAFVIREWLREIRESE